MIVPSSQWQYKNILLAVKITLFHKRDHHDPNLIQCLRWQDSPSMNKKQIMNQNCSPGRWLKQIFWFATWTCILVTIHVSQFPLSYQATRSLSKYLLSRHRSLEIFSKGYSCVLCQSESPMYATFHDIIQLWNNGKSWHLKS